MTIKLRKFRTVSRMTIGGKELEPGTAVSLDPSDPVVRSWMMARNVVPVKKQGKGRKADRVTQIDIDAGVDD